jgi:hypothetical protein
MLRIFALGAFLDGEGGSCGRHLQEDAPSTILGTKYAILTTALLHEDRREL